ncbi:MAG: insulinase family protein [Bacteroidetes bacterium]|nr:insulinase family protein [Bacteroidota bacterium]MBS1631773.1 insulinase family protein [Bacteroidota bacterium]
MKKLLFFNILMIFIFRFSFGQSAPSFPDIDIAFRKFKLDNGLTLIVHEDHKAPIVAVNVWYHVGSKNEKPGKTGFAHLFEHLMFNGSENYNQDYFKQMESIGATDLNGTTNEDRTNYFQNVPVSALDQVLFLESDRMGHLLGAIDTARLNEQRGVVQNEKRQGENQPYAIAYDLINKNTYPSNHPYSWTVIGSMDDLDAASLDDVKTWFKTYYGPNNAVLVVAGDITPEVALEKVKKYFGDIPPGPPISKQTEWIAKMKNTHRLIVQDRVPQARTMLIWNIPEWGTEQGTYLNLLSDVLSSGKSSRLYKRLVYDEQLASSVSSFIDSKEIGGQFMIQADAKPGVPLEKIESIINEELQKLIKNGVNPDELNKVKTQYFAGFIKGMERIGGFGGKSDILAQNEVYGGSPDYYKKVNAWIKSAKGSDLQKVAADWLSDGLYALQVLPFPDLKPDVVGVDRKSLPPLGPPPAVKFPQVQEFTLSNGLKVMLAQRTGVPVVNMRLMLDAGFASDQFSKPGVSQLAMNMLNEGTRNRTAIQISDELDNLGASLSTGSDLDNSFIGMNALKTNFDKSLDLFSDVILNANFPEKDFERLKKEQLLNIKQEQSQPITMALRILPGLLYGKDHAYGNPYTGSGYEESVSKITRNDLVKYYQTWLAPNHATLFVVGDITAAELKAGIEAKLSGWKKKDIPSKNISTVKMPAKTDVYILDKPGALQSTVITAELSPSGQSKDWINMDMMNRILGSEFTSRINMNLREDKHWSYGSGSILMPAAGQGFFAGLAPVQTDKTKESIIELKKELDQYVTDKPPTKDEFDKVQENAVLQLPGGWETNASVLSALQEQVQYNRGSSYWPNYASMIRNLTVEDMKAAARKVIDPAKLIWVIVGDREKIEKGIRDLNLGTIHIIDSEGKETKAF